MQRNKQVYLITGSEGSIGKSIANFYKNKKIRCIQLDKKFNKNTILSSKKIRLDLTSETKVKNFFNNLNKKKIYPSVLINCAGFFENNTIIKFDNGKFISHRLNEFDKIIKSNLYSTFLMSIHYSKLLIENKKKGLIINFGSISESGNVGQIAYSSAKAAVSTLTKTLVKEIGHLGIRSVCVSPGYFNTKSTIKVMDKYKLSTIEKNVPLRRLGNINEIIKTVNYVINNEYINGTTIDINGGLSI